ncbi:MAG: superoxide dismutase, Ni [Pseudomonadota bacterium]
MHDLIDHINRAAKFSETAAHCDIPCKIYDPSAAQVSALTVLRMVNLIQEMESAGEVDAAAVHSMTRFVATKEEHGSRCKDEIRIIWGDYFKAPQLERFPEIHELTHKIMMLASQCKQTVSRDKAHELVEAVNRFSEIFWATKDVETKRALCPYTPSVEVVYPDLT